MKCPECGYNQKVKYGLTCGHCNYTFCFNPKESGPLKVTDGKFRACIKSASQQGTQSPYESSAVEIRLDRTDSDRRGSRPHPGG